MIPSPFQMIAYIVNCGPEQSHRADVMTGYDDETDRERRLAAWCLLGKKTDSGSSVTPGKPYMMSRITSHSYTGALGNSLISPNGIAQRGEKDPFFLSFFLPLPARLSQEGHTIDLARHRLSPSRQVKTRHIPPLIPVSFLAPPKKPRFVQKRPPRKPHG